MRLEKHEDEDVNSTLGNIATLSEGSENADRVPSLKGEEHSQPLAFRVVMKRGKTVEVRGTHMVLWDDNLVIYDGKIINAAFEADVWAYCYEP